MNFSVACEESPTKLQHDRCSSIWCHWDSYDVNTPFVLVQLETKDHKAADPFFGTLGLGLSCSSRLHAARLLGEGLHLLIVVRGFALKNMEILLLLFFPQGKNDLPLVWFSFPFWNDDDYGVDDHDVHYDYDYWASGLGARGAACLDWACTEAREASHASLPSFLYLSILAFALFYPPALVTKLLSLTLFKCSKTPFSGCIWTLCSVDLGYRALSWVVRWGWAQISKE